MLRRRRKLQPMAHERGQARRRLIPFLAALGLVLSPLLAVLSSWAASHPEDLPGSLQAIAEDPWVTYAVGSGLYFIIALAVLFLDRGSGSDALTLPSPFEQHDRKLMIERSSNRIKDLLRPVANDPGLINLGLKARPEFVESPHEEFVARFAETRDDPAVDAAFDNADGLLLVVGAVGAGKSRLLAELGLQLLSRAKRDPALPVPVVVNLATWAGHRRSLLDWLAYQLRDDYVVTLRLGRGWIAHRQILPLLDGLDEVPESHRASCITAINMFLAQHGPGLTP
jgi:hypothetical protein